MLPKVLPSLRKTVAVLTVAIGVLAGTTVYLLQTRGDQIVFAPLAVGALGSLLALFQWLIAQWRESNKTSWEAVKNYYSEGDDEKYKNARRKVGNDDMSEADTHCSFYEKWGRLVKMGYLPVDVFDGPSGARISALLPNLERFIKEVRADGNHRYAQSYVWLVSEIQRRGYLKGHPDERRIAAVLSHLGAG